MKNSTMVLIIKCWLANSKEEIERLGVTPEIKSVIQGNKVVLNLQGRLLASIGFWGDEGALDLDYMKKGDTETFAVSYKFETEADLEHVLNECLKVLLKT
jgi:hypothetical protein